jgi:hypothetical protein
MESGLDGDLQLYLVTVHQLDVPSGNSCDRKMDGSTEDRAEFVSALTHIWSPALYRLLPNGIGLLNICECLLRVGSMGQPKSTEESMYSPAIRPRVGSAALETPTMSPFIASMEEIRETAPAPARWPSVLNRIGESSKTARTAPTHKRDNDHASGHVADH